MSQGRYEGSIRQAGQVCGTTSCACDRSGVEMLTAVEKCVAEHGSPSSIELTRLKKLQVLSLEGLGIGDAEVELLSAFEGLEKLSLCNNPVTDAGMKTVGRLKELRRLSLVSTKVTDEGLQLLATCSKLEMVDLHNTKVTRKGIAALQKALPNCIVTVSFSNGGIPDFEIIRDESGVTLIAPKDGLAVR